MLHSLLDFVLKIELQTKEVAFADDLTVAGKLADIISLLDDKAQAAYLAFVSESRNKLNYFMRTVLEISHHLVPLKEHLEIDLYLQ